MKKFFSPLLILGIGLLSLCLFLFFTLPATAKMRYLGNWVSRGGGGGTPPAGGDYKWSEGSNIYYETTLRWGEGSKR